MVENLDGMYCGGYTIILDMDFAVILLIKVASSF